MSVSTLLASGTCILFQKRAFIDKSDFLLKPELLRAISDLGFEHPSEGMVTFRSLRRRPLTPGFV